jgi:glycine hydroxymethyltransferase
MNQDDIVFQYINDEKERQINGLEMIASENFTSKNVIRAVGSCLMNKYGEGYPNRRYYGGCSNVDNVETLCQSRALELFNLNPEIWGVNVQPLCGSVANFALYNAILDVGDNISGLDLKSGGHLTHGFRTEKRKVSASSKYFNSHPYHIKDDGYIDYDEMEEIVRTKQIKMLIIGYSAYPRDLDYKRCREIADKYDCHLHCDMAHFSGLVASGLLDNPFDYCDTVVTTTHKTLRGPRGALIYFKNELKMKVNNSVFPGMQGGPFFHCIAGIAVALKEANSDEYINYIKQVVKNMQAFVEKLKEYDYKFITDGTDNHLCLIDLKPKGLTGQYVEDLLQSVEITVNKNTVVGDKSALKPNGLRIGSPALTSRGMKEVEFIQIAEWIHEIIQHPDRVEEIKNKVVAMAKQFPHPSF